MSGSVDLLRRLAAVEQRSGQIYDQVCGTYVGLTANAPQVVNAALNVGTYILGPIGDAGADYTANYPSTAKALSVLLAVQWGAASNSYYAYCRPNGASANEGLPFVFSQVANIYSTCGGILNLDSDARAQIVVVGANANALVVKILGHIV